MHTSDRKIKQIILIITVSNLALSKKGKSRKDTFWDSRKENKKERLSFEEGQ